MTYRSTGFTLVELLITLAVMAIVMGIAVPSFTALIRNNTSTSIAKEFTDTLALARSEAVKRPARVSICSSTTGEDCDGEWNEGYIVFVDNATTDDATDPVVGEILKYWQPPKGVVQINVAFGTTATSFFRFTSSGRLARISANPLTANIMLTGCTGQNARKITINLSGQSSVQPEDC